MSKKYVPTFSERDRILTAADHLDNHPALEQWVSVNLPKVTRTTISEHNLAIWRELVPIAHQNKVDFNNTRRLSKKTLTPAQRAVLAKCDARYAGSVTAQSSIAPQPVVSKPLLVEINNPIGVKDNRTDKLRGAAAGNACGRAIKQYESYIGRKLTPEEFEFFWSRYLLQTDTKNN